MSDRLTHVDGTDLGQVQMMFEGWAACPIVGSSKDIDVGNCQVIVTDEVVVVTNDNHDQIVRLEHVSWMNAGVGKRSLLFSEPREVIVLHMMQAHQTDIQGVVFKVIPTMNGVRPGDVPKALLRSIPDRWLAKPDLTDAHRQHLLEIQQGQHAQWKTEGKRREMHVLFSQPAGAQA